MFWGCYSVSSNVLRFKTLNSLAAPGTSAAGQGVRTTEEEAELQKLSNALFVGFAVVGYHLPDRTPSAQVLSYHPGMPEKPMPQSMRAGQIQWWGVPNFFTRLLVGIDGRILGDIQNSGKWTGTTEELAQLAQAYSLIPQGILPIRDAVDYVHSCIYSTIKAIKFSGVPQVCGGPIEIAVITSDRKFRWVRHKPWDAAIVDGAI